MDEVLEVLMVVVVVVVKEERAKVVAAMEASRGGCRVRRWILPPWPPDDPAP
jgi:hypothetical protein